MPSTRGRPGARHEILCGESNSFGHPALQGPGGRGAKRAPGGAELALRKLADHAPQPGLGLGAPCAID
eukprot:2856965-Pyramimonas_sp.AAC.1